MTGASAALDISRYSYSHFIVDDLPTLYHNRSRDTISPILISPPQTMAAMQNIPSPTKTTTTTTYRLPPRPLSDGEAGPSYVIISGGTGANSIVSAFGPSPAFVLPVSDDGGSSAEILRCFGGPSIGDISESCPRYTLTPAHSCTYQSLFLYL